MSLSEADPRRHILLIARIDRLRKGEEMRGLVIGIIIGLAFGLVVGLTLPLQASSLVDQSHRLTTLEQRVARLEKKTRHLNLRGVLNASALTAACGIGASAIWHGAPGSPVYLGC